MVLRNVVETANEVGLHLCGAPNEMKLRTGYWWCFEHRGMAPCASERTVTHLKLVSPTISPDDTVILMCAFRQKVVPWPGRQPIPSLHIDDEEIPMNTRCIRRPLSIAMTAMATVVAMPCLATTTFPSGDFVIGKTTLHFDGSSKFSVNEVKGGLVVEGTYLANTDQITLTDKSGK